MEPLAPVLTKALTMALNSNSAMARCCYVRLCARAGGLGSGMGMFVLQPLVAALGTAAEVAAECVHRWEGVLQALAQCRGVLQVLLPLCTRPALKVQWAAVRDERGCKYNKYTTIQIQHARLRNHQAAMLSLPTAPLLATMLRALADMGVPRGLQSLGGEGIRVQEAGVLQAMALEVVSVLCSAQHALDVGASETQRAHEDVPKPEDVCVTTQMMLRMCTQLYITMCPPCLAQASALLAAVLQSVPQLEVSATAAQRLLTPLWESPQGQTMLARAVVRWYAQSGAGASMQAMKQAFTFASARLRSQGAV